MGYSNVLCVGLQWSQLSLFYMNALHDSQRLNIYNYFKRVSDEDAYIKIVEGSAFDKTYLVQLRSKV